MAFIQKRPEIKNAVQFYTLGLNKTLLVAGLGNIGKEYEKTPHNIGFVAVDSFAKTNDFPDWTLKKDLKCYFAQSTINQVKVILIKPTTMMNLSGEAIKNVMSFYKIPPSQLIVVHDELDINFGQIRTRSGGSAAGHNGIKSTINVIGEDFYRLRIGIGPKRPKDIDSADFVLKNFQKKQIEEMPALCKESDAILSEFVYNSGTLEPETRTFLV